MKNNERLSASFRDPSGFLFERESILYRQINRSYQADYDLLMKSGLYEKLVKGKKLIPHEEIDTAPAIPDLAYRVIKPEKVAFISYPYEWSFSQLKDAALLTLSIQKQALEFGLSLKDASAYNIQFHHGKTVLIDSLSFEAYQEGKPWVAYRQFCQHFLAPLALMAIVDIRLSQLLRVYIDGIPLDLASKLLPWRTRVNFGLLAHIHLHASAQKKYADAPDQTKEKSAQVGKMGLVGLIESLQKTVKSLTWMPKGTEWGEYYDATNYTREAFDQKQLIVKAFLEKVGPRCVWDLGANTGVFSRLAADAGVITISSDIDPAAVEKNYLDTRQKKEKNLIPLVLDLTNPSPGIGWGNKERDSFADRGPVDVVMALALVHHLAISNNVPLPDVASYFAGLGNWLIVEFIPKEDSQVMRLLATREDIFPMYYQSGFEEAFQTCFTIEDSRTISGSKRVMYLLKTKNSLV
ncbi:MAG: class I SAM-dependent methyltransferase [Anaerolineaceae bacterium]|nr:class I SAM-dependent methyltransferase [Anaerolineaceae bacterium]